MNNKYYSIIQIVVSSILYAVSIFVLICHVLGYRGAYVIGDSMMPTFRAGSICVSKLIDKAYVPHHDDVICFFPFGEDNDDTLFIKRIIGVEGDILQAKDGVLTRNGDFVCAHPWIGTWSTEVSTGTVFVLGDNYGRSTDSRILGEIPLENIHLRICAKIIP